MYVYLRIIWRLQYRITPLYYWRKAVSACARVRVRMGCLCMSAKLCVKRRLKIRCAVGCPLVGSPLVCVRQMQSHGQNGYMEPFTFTDTDTDTDTDTRTWGHPMSMSGDPKIFTDADTDTRTCRDSCSRESVTSYSLRPADFSIYTAHLMGQVQVHLLVSCEVRTLLARPAIIYLYVYVPTTRGPPYVTHDFFFFNLSAMIYIPGIKFPHF